MDLTYGRIPGRKPHTVLAVVLAALGLGLIVAGCDELLLPPAPNPPEDGEPPSRIPSDGSDERRPTLAIADVSGTEGADQISFTVRLDHAGSEQIVVSYSTEDATATGGSDFQAVSGTLTFPANSAGDARQIDVPLIDDQVHEGDETFRLALDDPQGTLAGATATGLIEDDDPLPRLSIADASGNEGSGALQFNVRLAPASAREVTVRYATADGSATAFDDYTPHDGTLTFPAGSTERTLTVAIVDDALDEEDQETLQVTLSAPVGAVLRVPTAAGTVADDDLPPQAAVADASAREDGGLLRFTVRLDPASGRAVTVGYATRDGTTAAGSDYEPAAGTVTFSPGATTRTIDVRVTDDQHREGDEFLTLVLSNPRNATLANSGATATGLIEDDDPLPRVSIADASGNEGSGALRFPVRLAPASVREVTVRYATADGSATAFDDYTPNAGTLTFPAGSTERTLAVAIVDDALDEEDRETLQVTLSAPVGAVLRVPTATGTVTDDDPPPQAAVADASAREDGGALRFTVRLAPASGRIVAVDYTTRDGTAAAGSDYESAVGTLAFSPGSTTRTVDVRVTDDQVHEENETLTLALSNPQAATLTAAAATGTIVDDDAAPIPDLPVDPQAALELASLAVTGAGPMYPAFDGGIKHYAARCAAGTAVTVTARSAHSGLRLTLLRAASADSVSAVGTLSAHLTVDPGHDIAIEIGAGGRTATYVVHCIPTDFPNIRILKKTAGASDGLLLISFSEDYYHAVVDYNGVPRHHFTGAGWSFRPHSDGPYVNGTQIRYSRVGNGAVYLMDAEFNLVHTERYSDLDRHDFVLGPNSYFFVRYVWEFRDMRVLGGSDRSAVQDSVITEVPYDGSAPVHWNSWDHLKIADCRYHTFPGFRDYAHLNSLQIVDGDLIASFHGCGQVIRIDWPSGSVEWQLGGSNPPRGADTDYLEIVGDPLAGFHGQHQATLTGTRILLFDNGTFRGLADGSGGHPRILHRNPVNTRVVEYDISSGTQAAFVREYRRPDGHSYSLSAGGVTLLDNGNWLIAWGQTSESARSIAREAVAVVTEVDTAGATVFHMNITTHGDSIMRLYRAYYADAADVAIPTSLP